MIGIGAVLALGVLLGVWLLSGRNRPSEPVPLARLSERLGSKAELAASPVGQGVPSQGARTKQPYFPSRAERNRMSDGARLRYLEQLGHVPEDGDAKDWHLAEKTSWWGKPLDPKEFWKGRVIWLDEEARSAANRRGHRYPPIPYEDPSLPAYPNDDGIKWNVNTIDSGPISHFAKSSKEVAFWDRFMKTAPKIPADLERQQLDVAVSLLEDRDRPKKGHLPVAITPGMVAQSEDIEKRRAFELGYPPEAFTEDAMFWAYVLARRRDYEEMAVSRVPRDQVAHFLSRLAVNLKYITEPLTEEHMKAANAWKIAYLQRLRREKAEESYIKAYLEAWNFLPRDVFTQAE
jgi:hypothetical protein